MSEKYTREMVNLLRDLKNIDYIEPSDIPNIDLYMDQVTTFMDEHLKSSKRFEEDKILTKTMINNYTKNNLLPPPVKKKYSKEHMLLLIFIYYFKNFLSINDIQEILNPISDQFFQQEKGLSLSDVYEKVFDLQNNNTDDLIKDLLRKIKKSSAIFQDVDDPKEQKTLNEFALISMLSFDIWVKKTLIENIIDKKKNEQELKKQKQDKDAKKTKQKK